MMKLPFFFLILISSFLLAIKCEQNNQNVEEENTAMQKSSTSSVPYKIGDVIKDFSLQNIDDNYLSLSDYKEVKGFIIIFTCNMCPYSEANEDRILALDAKYKPQGYPVIAINPNDPDVVPGDSFEAMKVRAEEKQFTFPYLFDEDQTVFPKFGAGRTPHVFIVSSETEGNVLQYIGAIDDSSLYPEKVSKKYVEMAVNALLSNEKPPITETKAIGCSIKVKK